MLKYWHYSIEKHSFMYNVYPLRFYFEGTNLETWWHTYKHVHVLPTFLGTPS